MSHTLSYTLSYTFSQFSSFEHRTSNIGTSHRASNDCRRRHTQPPSLLGLVITHIFWRPGVGLADITGRGGATDGFA